MLPHAKVRRNPSASLRVNSGRCQPFPTHDECVEGTLLSAAFDLVYFAASTQQLHQPGQFTQNSLWCWHLADKSVRPTWGFAYLLCYGRDDDLRTTALVGARFVSLRVPFLANGKTASFGAGAPRSKPSVLRSSSRSGQWIP